MYVYRSLAIVVAAYGAAISILLGSTWWCAPWLLIITLVVCPQPISFRSQRWASVFRLGRVLRMFSFNTLMAYIMLLALVGLHTLYPSGIGAMIPELSASDIGSNSLDRLGLLLVGYGVGRMLLTLACWQENKRGVWDPIVYQDKHLAALAARVEALDGPERDDALDALQSLIAETHQVRHTSVIEEIEDERQVRRAAREELASITRL